jgi:prepilin peptidase CpaA
VNTHRIPNSLVIMALALGLIEQLTLAPTLGLAYWVGGAGTGLAIFLPFYIGGGMGAGDVKLMAAVGGFLGFEYAALSTGVALIAGLPLVLLFVAGRYLKGHAEQSTPAPSPTPATDGVPGEPEDYATGRFQIGRFYVGATNNMKHAKENAKNQRIPYAAAVAAGAVFGLWYSGRIEQLAGALML